MRGPIRLKNWAYIFSGLIIGIPVFYRRRFRRGLPRAKLCRRPGVDFHRASPLRGILSQFVVCDTGPSIPAASVCYPVEAGSLRSGIRSPNG
jgi:hypothetical protein